MRDAILFVIILLGIALSSLCQSGDQGSIGGTAFDASGAVVVGAQVHVRNLGTSFVASTTTDDRGLFRFPVLPVGLYELTAGHSGFATAKVNQIDLTVGAQLTLTLRFSVAGGNEATNVTDAPRFWRRVGANSAQPSIISLFQSYRSTGGTSQPLCCLRRA